MTPSDRDTVTPVAPESPHGAGGTRSSSHSHAHRSIPTSRRLPPLPAPNEYGATGSVQIALLRGSMLVAERTEGCFVRDRSVPIAPIDPGPG